MPRLQSPLGNSRALFGTDGLRGRANLDVMTCQVALELGSAVAKSVRRERGRGRVVIGRDTRISGDMLEGALVAGLCSMGIDPIMVGHYPTSAVAFLTKSLGADAGIAISASHNPFWDNGIKLFTGKGLKLTDAEQAELEALTAESADSRQRPVDQAIGRCQQLRSAERRYIEFVKRSLPEPLTLKGMNIALDCAHGAAHRVAPRIFSELGARVSSIGVAPNGVNINDRCGSTHLAAIGDHTRAINADLGIALDGDADRVALVDELGRAVSGDALLALCALDFKRRGALRGDRLVVTPMVNGGFLRAMRSEGIEVESALIGDRHVVQKMLQRDANFGGEPSGHLIFFDHHTTSDGIIAALQILRIAIETGQKLSQLGALVRPDPRAIINLPVSAKPPLEAIAGFAELERRIAKTLGQSGRVLVRYSGTEAVCRILVEAEHLELANDLANQLRDHLTPHCCAAR